MMRYIKYKTVLTDKAEERADKGVLMDTHPLLSFIKNLDRSIKLTLGIWGCIIAPMMIWAGLLLLILSILGINLGLTSPILLGLQLILAGIFWELVTYFTFSDTEN
jgi:hypothetical protein